MGMDLEHLDGGRARLRAVVAIVDRELSLAPRAKNDGTLSASWAELVALLALGPAPAVRECPACGHLGMRDATRCGYCWVALPPLAAAAAE